MRERIKQVRKRTGLNQEDFAKKMGLSKSFIAQIEMGAKVPSDRTVNDICRIFNVNKHWLETGEGEMLIIRLEKDEIRSYVEELLAYTSNPPDPADVNPFYEAIITALQNYHDMDETSKRCARELFRMRRREAEAMENGEEE